MKHFTFLTNRSSRKSVQVMTRTKPGNDHDMSRTCVRLDSHLSRFSVASLICLLMLTLGVGNAWGTSYTITFSGSASESTALSTDDNASKITSSSYVTGKIQTATKAYGATSTGVKLGTSNNAGVLKINLTSSGQLTNPVIIVKAKRYNSGTNATIAVNGATAVSTVANFRNYAFKISGKITYIQLNASKYLWVESVTVTDECNTIDVTGGSAVILPAGNAVYATNAWGENGAPRAAASSTSYPIGNNGYCVSFNNAYEDGGDGQANGLRCNASGGAISIAGITSNNGVDIDVVVSGTNNFTVSLTGASNVTGNNQTLSISTTSTTATLTVTKGTSNNGYIKTITITPKAAASVPVTGVSVSPTSKTILVGETFTVTPTVSPVGATDKSVSWTSSASGKASVNSSGVVTGVAAGTANITCTTTDGSFTATCATTVYSASVTSIVDEDGTDISSSGVSASVSGRTLTASEGSTKYKFKTWKYGTANGTSISSATSLSTTLSGTPTGNVTLIAEFYKPVEVAWTKGGTTYSTGGPTTSVKRGTQWKDLTIPTAPGDASLGSCADKFMGWSNCSDLIGTGNSAPGVLFTSVSGITTEITTPIEFKAVFATAGAGGAGEKIKITPTNSELPAAGSYNASSTSFTIGDYTFKHNNWCKSADPPATYNIQAKKNIALSVYNVDAFENKIDRVVVYQTGTARSVTITGSYYYDEDEAEADGGTFTEEAITSPSTAATMSFSFSGKNHRYFYMSTPGNAVYMDSIIIYTRNSITYSNYVTKCCTNLGSINGSVNLTYP